MTDQCVEPSSLSQAFPNAGTLEDSARPATKSPPLFDHVRLRLYPLTIFFFSLTAVFLDIFWSHNGLTFDNEPLGYDFITFWGASLLSLKGHAESAFHPIFILDAERTAIAANDQFYLWHYPPTFQLVILPLAFLPYGAAWLSFVGMSLIAYVRTLFPLLKIRAADHSTKIFLILGFPGTYLAVAHGQNSMISAALFAGAALFIPSRPIFAGVVLGLFAFKPQLALLVPLALIAGRQWRALFAAGVTAVLFCLIATQVFGFELWAAFFKNTAFVRILLEKAWLRWEKIPSAYIFFHMIGVPNDCSYAIQAITAFIAALTVIIVWRRTGPTRLAFAVLISASLLALPYLFDYEFAILAVPLAILASDMDLNGASLGEKAALVFLYMMPLFAAPLAQYTRFQIGFLALILCLTLCVKRVVTGSIPKIGEGCGEKTSTQSPGHELRASPLCDTSIS